MIRVLELFGGIGACSKALERLGVDYEIADYVEIDKYAVMSFNAIHGTHFEPQDITEWDKDIDVDLIMHGSPCQDFSVAGRGAGGDEGSGTRSSLMYETIRIVEKLKPKYVIWENVKNLLSKKHRHNFDAYLVAMEKLGYINYYQVLNAKDYGIPQNRERVFTVSIREDIAKERYLSSATAMAIFEFPETIPLKKKLKDMLDDEVNEKYYLSDKALAGYVRHNSIHEKRGNGFKFEPTNGDTIAHTISTKAGGRTTDNFLKVITANKQGYDLATDGDGIDLAYPNSSTRRGRVGHGVSKTLPTSDSQGCLDGMRIRKLTPKECWRLMGFDDSDFEKAAKVNSNTQLYKQAGNSIVVNVLEAILSNML